MKLFLNKKNIYFPVFLKSCILFFILIASFKCFASTIYTASYHDTLNVRQIDSIIKSTKYKKEKKFKIKGQGYSGNYWVNIQNSQIIYAEINESNVFKTLTRYYFIQGRISKVIYLVNKPDHTNGGGLYYFSREELIYKEEKNIPPQDINKFTSNADYYKKRGASLAK